jgi:hypothetical protein
VDNADGHEKESIMSHGRSFVEAALMHEVVERELERAKEDADRNEGLEQDLDDDGNVTAPSFTPEKRRRIDQLASTSEEIVLTFGNYTFRTCPTQLCEYCSMSEADICSPLVIGQTWEEYVAHERAHTSLVAKGFIKQSKRGQQTCVKLKLNGHQIAAPQPPYPFFPLVGVNFDDEHKLTGPIVHELCALNMTHARMSRKVRYVFTK